MVNGKMYNRHFFFAMVDCILLDNIYEILIYTYVYYIFNNAYNKRKGKTEMVVVVHCTIVMFQAEALYQSQGLQLET